VFAVYFGIPSFFAGDAAHAQYAEWYLRCAIAHYEDVRGPERSVGYSEVSEISIYISFNNGGYINDDDVKVIYVPRGSDRERSPFSLFDVVRFTRDRALLTGKVSWTGTDARVFPRAWSMRGEVRVSEDGAQVSYVEELVERTIVRSRMTSDCVFDNPN